MTQLTLVSLYGEKDPAFADLISECQSTASAALGAAFVPYEMRQVHATIVGLETAPGLHNRNFRRFRGADVDMDFDGLLHFLRESPLLPFHVQIGGYEDRDYPFTSDPFEVGKGSRPFQRSVAIWHNKMVIMGWPVRRDSTTDARTKARTPDPGNQHYPPILDKLRRGAQRFGILHAYHRTETAVDNDLYFRIGLVEPDSAALPALETEMRSMLASRAPLCVDINLDNLFVVAYTDDKLPLATTVVLPVADERVNGSTIARFLE